MDIKLKFFLISLCLIFLLIISKKVETDHLQLRYSFPWYIVTFALILVTVFDGILEPLKSFLGFEKISNMVFLGGFIVIIMIVFSLNIKVSELTTKNIILTQEVAILKKELEENEKKS